MMFTDLFSINYSIGGGLSIGIVKSTRFKNTFKEAKDAAKDALNTCPVEVIRRFINRSWRWTHGKGCTVGCSKAKGSSQCLEESMRTAMMHLDAILNSS